MSADTLPISPSRFAAALEDLPVSTLHLKVLELRNSIAHLDYSNEQLRPFAEGTASTASPQPQSQQTSQSQSASETTAQTPSFEPDQDCLDAIRENEQVIERMQERIRLIRAEVEGRRGLSWTEFQSQEERDAAAAAEAAKATEGQGEGAGAGQQVNGQVNGVHPATTAANTHSAWSDGTFQTGVIRDGVVQMDDGGRQTQTQQSGGSLTDEELRRRIELQMRGLGGEEEDDEGGLYL